MRSQFRFLVLTRHDGVPMRVNIGDISIYSPRCPASSDESAAHTDLRMTDGWTVIVKEPAPHIDAMLVDDVLLDDIGVFDLRGPEVWSPPSPDGVPSSSG